MAGRSLWLSGLQFTLAKVLPVCDNKPNRLDLRAGCNIAERSRFYRDEEGASPSAEFPFHRSLFCPRAKFRISFNAHEKILIIKRYDNPGDSRKMMN